jgi:hypothetical protein
METADKEHKMAGAPIGTPGSAEGTENPDDQSKVPPAAHTPGSAENGALDDSDDSTDDK